MENEQVYYFRHNEDGQMMVVICNKTDNMIEIVDSIVGEEAEKLYKIFKGE